MPKKGSKNARAAQAAQATQAIKEQEEKEAKKIVFPSYQATTTPEEISSICETYGAEVFPEGMRFLTQDYLSFYPVVDQKYWYTHIPSLDEANLIYLCENHSLDVNYRLCEVEKKGQFVKIKGRIKQIF